MQSWRDKMSPPGLRREPTAVSHCKKLHHICGLFVLLVLGLTYERGFSAAELQPQQSASLSPDSRLSFAVADFDGDRHPDLITVQPAVRDSSQTDYWLQLRLSAYGRRFIRLAGPKGGLKIEARDVNGDNTVDLVVATVWRDQPVAILLNDGYGNFSKVDPSVFPCAFSRSSKDWNGSAVREAYAVPLPRESSAGEFPLARVTERLKDSSEHLPFVDTPSVSNRPDVLRAGRAPPATTLL